jgi:hypothetical protein
MVCPICNGEMRSAFNATVLRKYLARYQFCGDCGFLRIVEPHWLDEAYSSAISAADTGLVVRNIAIAAKVSAVLYAVLGERGEGRYLDVAGGCGLLTRIMRDQGFDFYWSDKYCQNILARGFEYDQSKGACVAVTAMEVFEHLIDPIEFVDRILTSSGADTLLFSTELYSGTPPSPQDWWYYSLPTGQHIGFFQRRTLEILGHRLNLRFTSANGLHVLSRRLLDSRLFAIATNRFLSRLAAPYIRRMVGSRTFDDYHKVIHKIES